MSAEDLENYETDAQMALYREYKDVMSLFSYAVETDRRFYLANQVDVTPHAYSVRDVNVEERLPNQEFTVPEMPDFSA